MMAGIVFVSNPKIIIFPFLVQSPFTIYLTPYDFSFSNLESATDLVHSHMHTPDGFLTKLDGPVEAKTLA